MSESKVIKDIVRQLKKDGVIKSNEDIRERMGYKRVGTVSDNLNKDPLDDGFLALFCAKFNIPFEKIRPNVSPNGESKSYVQRRSEQKLRDDKIQIPFYDADAAAGTQYAMDMNAVTQPTSTIDIGDMLRDSQAAMRVYGNSMIPGYPPGSVIGLRKNYDGFIEPGTVYVIETKSNRYIKRLFYNDDKTGYLCVSDNEIKYEHGPMQGRYFYPPFEIPFEAINALFDVTGVVKRNKNSVIVTKED